MRDIYIREPVNKSAAVATSQSGCEDDFLATREDLNFCVAKIERKRRLIKHMLGITSRTKHKNLMARHAKKGRDVSGHKKPRILAEYVKTGENLNRIKRRIGQLNINPLTEV